MLIRSTALVSRVLLDYTFGSNYVRLRIVHGTWLLFSLHCKYCDGRTEPFKLSQPRVIELNIGTICASLPCLPAFYKHHRLKPSQVAALKTITNKIKPFSSSRKTSHNHLETGILGSVQGEGKFLKSGDLTNVTTSTSTTHLIEK